MSAKGQLLRGATAGQDHFPATAEAVTDASKLRAFWKEERPDFDVLRTAALTLLGLLIGFSFAIARSS